ncbi:MAG: 3-oxoadipate enol-lactonase [Burkholderiales bacterium]|nr:3-oxoadipate enol-lactonase [Burkholderiales bacterium]
MKVYTNGIETNYSVQGEGPWLVFSHSLACNLSMWAPQAETFSRKYKVLCYDTRGHGQSGAPAQPYTLEQLADDAKALFDALGIKQCHWVGLSMGGMIGQTFALRHPGIFKTMTLADTTSRYPPEGLPLWQQRIEIATERGMEPIVAAMLERWFTEPFRRSGASVIDAIAGAIRTTPVAGFVGCCHAIPKIDLTRRLREIKTPTLVMVGEHDPGTPPEMAREIHDNLPGSELVIVPAAAHLSNVERPEAFNTALTRFLERNV